MPNKSARRSIVSHASELVPGSGIDSADNAVSACAEWLARLDEQEKLARRWQKLESCLIRERQWFHLSERDQALLPEAAELDAFNCQLDELYALNQKLLTALPTIVATTTSGLACKLSVALALVHPDENKETHSLIRSILRDIETVVLTVRE